MGRICTWALFAGEEQYPSSPHLSPLSLQPSGGRQPQMNSLNTDDHDRAAVCGLSAEALKRDGVNKRSNASMDKSFDGMHENCDFDSIRYSVKKTISISMIVTSVLSNTVHQKYDICSLCCYYTH